jgi:hypothetical protein
MNRRTANWRKAKLSLWKASRASPLKAVSCHRTPDAPLLIFYLNESFALEGSGSDQPSRFSSRVINALNASAGLRFS